MCICISGLRGGGIAEHSYILSECVCLNALDGYVLRIGNAPYVSTKKPCVIPKYEPELMRVIELFIKIQLTIQPWKPWVIYTAK